MCDSSSAVSIAQGSESRSVSVYSVIMQVNTTNEHWTME